MKSGLTSGASQLVELYKKNNYDLQLNALIASYKDSELDKMSTALYEFFDWVSKGVEKAKIPQYVWNCDNSDEYQPVYASVYGMATVPLKPVRLLVQAQFSILLQKDPQNVFLLQNIQDAEQVEVAVLCGIWNGLVDIVAGVPKMISMLASIGSSKGWDDIEKIYVTMSDYKNPETGNVGITGALSDGVSTMFDPGKPCELAHNTSGIVVGVAMCFINPTAIKGTFGQVIANVVKIVQRLDAFADALNPLSRISNFVLKSAGTAMQATLKNGKLIIKVAMRADEVFREVDWSLAKTAQMIGPDGRTYTILMSNDPMDAARTAGRKLKEILEDEKGNSITDANGNGLAKVEVTDGEGNITEEVAVVKLGTEISEEAADLLTRLKHRLKNDYKWTDEEILAFEGDFKGDLDLLRKFDGDKGLVDSWKALQADELLRKSPPDLEVFSKYLEANPGKLDEVAEEFSKASNKLDYLGNKFAGTYTTKIKWGRIDIDARPLGDKGYWGKRIKQSDMRVDAYEKKINPNDESFYVENSEGSFVQFENVVAEALQDGKLVQQVDNSIYHVYDKPEFLRENIIKEAVRQVDAAKGKGLKVEWLVSDQKAVDQLGRFFTEKNIDIEVKFFAE